jgi:L-asparaginase
MKITDPGNVQAPVMLVHGGAGAHASDAGLLAVRRSFINELILQVWPVLLAGAAAVDAAQQAIEGLEADPHFNAGRGAVLQIDGVARLSASLMDGARQKFSGVALVTDVIHPSRLAYALQQKDQTVLGPLAAQSLARELGLPAESPLTPERIQQWHAYLAQAQAAHTPHGTVGVVVLDRHGQLAAATSTGGGSGNLPQRMSDSATVAGNYASAFAAISCTGIGEQIVDDGVAVRIETRVRDGCDIIQACERVWQEAHARQRQYGWIGIDRQGRWAMMATTEVMPCGAMSADRATPVIG